MRNFYVGQEVIVNANGIDVYGTLEAIQANIWGIIRLRICGQWYDLDQVQHFGEQRSVWFLGKLFTDISSPPVQLVEMPEHLAVWKYAGIGKCDSCHCSEVLFDYELEVGMLAGIKFCQGCINVINMMN